MAIHERASADRVGLLRDATLTLAAVVTAFLAVDDITTDQASTFVFERTAVAVCGLWFAWLAWRFVRRGRRALGLSSFGVVFAAAVAQPNIGPGTSPSWAAYLATVLCLAWFFLMSGLLAEHALRSAPRHAA